MFRLPWGTPAAQNTLDPVVYPAARHLAFVTTLVLGRHRGLAWTTARRAFDSPPRTSHRRVVGINFYNRIASG
jgi:hypothetical protein